MPKLPRVSGQQAIRALERIGFVQARQSGSHIVLKKQTPEGEVGCVVPLHRELAVGTLRGILKQPKLPPKSLWKTCKTEPTTQVHIASRRLLRC